ncbi:hypothetical protein MMUR_47770 [Mycolicibacterium murale]|uniref:Uncharacterized protein n=1 Tax=Mycolicibacterium murale TaxID=182220 RepID=A0A7I9WSC3_9MYCO|nr:hypothetical protein MMUR_47770 [Mycolicibacterium murale]
MFNRDRDHCCPMCRLVDAELTKAQEECESGFGDDAHWLSAVALNDALTEYLSSSAAVRKLMRQAVA